MWKLFKTFLVSAALILGGCAGSTNPGHDQTYDDSTEQEQPAIKSLDIAVPDFSNKTKDEVDVWKEEKKIEDDRMMYAYEYSETIAKDYVISQSITPGEKIGEKNLSVTISNGYDPDAKIEFIDFSGMTIDEIHQWFVNEHFENVSVEYVYDLSVPLGTYKGMNINTDYALRTDPIVIKVTGDAQQAGVGVEVPNMLGWSRGEVEEWGNKNQITVGYVHELSNNVAKNKVISTSPAAGETVLRKNGITVNISDGNEITAINLAGKSQTEINDWGKKNGVQVSWVQCWSDLRSGTVYYNQPNNGVMHMGDIMKVFISVGPIPVKDYTSLNYTGNFMGWLNSINSQYNATANLRVSVSQQESTDLADGTIISQYPNSGYINPNSTIQLVIAKHVDPAPTPAPEPTKVKIPNMAGMSEYDFKRSLHAYGVWEGARYEQYSNVIAEGYVIQNDVGEYNEGDKVGYTVSLGKFVLNEHDWAGADYSTLETYINSVNRFGANVRLDPSYIDTGDKNDDNRITMVEQLDDGTIHVRVTRYYE